LVKLIYSRIASLDGYVENEQGKFDWAAPEDDEVHAFVNELERPIGTYLYGRRMYETMVFWETVSGGANQPAVIRDFAEIWWAPRRLCSREAPDGGQRPDPDRAHLRPRRGSARQGSRGSRHHDWGAELALAGQAIAAELVDELHLFLRPIIVGDGKRALPDGIRVPLALLEERRFRNGAVHLHYRVRG
jgi:dihydrofolate reductase